MHRASTARGTLVHGAACLCADRTFCPTHRRCFIWHFAALPFLRSRTGEDEQPSNVMAVGSTQRRHVRQAHRIVVETMTVTPRKGWLAKPAREGIAHHARPSPIAVCEGMDRHQAMMEANGDLVCRIRVELDPGAGIREGSPKLGIDLPPVAADILVRAAIGPSPIRLFVSKMSLIIGLFL